MVPTTGLPFSEDNEVVLLRLYRLLLIGFFLFFLGGALSIPFIYETQTLWYKTGVDKIMLRAGQLLGLFAAALLFVQLVFAARGKFFKRLFGIEALVRYHRINGTIISFLLISHVTLILAPEGLTNLPIGIKFWPEMVGILLFWIILSMAISSNFREKLGLDYKKWRRVHQLLGYLSFTLLPFHILFVSESFLLIVPRVAFGATFFVVGMIVVLSKMQRG